MRNPLFGRRLIADQRAHGALPDRSQPRQPVDQSPDDLPLLRGESLTTPATRVALVTGAGRGIGREVVLALAREGCHVVLAARTLGTRAVLPAMLERRWGRVINIASLAGLHGASYVTAYTASKHALVGLTRALAAEVAGTGVTVNAICPGFAATDLTWESARKIAARTGRSFEESVEAMARLNPGRRLVEPAEVAAVAAKLLHDESTNGDTSVLDGDP